MRKYFVILVLALCSVGTLKGQTASDSLADNTCSKGNYPQECVYTSALSVPPSYQPDRD